MPVDPRTVAMLVVCGLAAADAPFAAGSERPETVESVLEEARATRTFRALWPGDRARGHRVTDGFTREGSQSRTPSFHFMYGDCGTNSCLAPVEVQAYAACARNLAMYRRGPAQSRIRYRRVTIRGVPAIEVPEVDNNARVELYSGRSTTVVFAASLGVARSVARVLRSVDGRIGPRDRLPRPVKGHLTGKARCK